jgi:putative sterol carrier protein
MVVFPSKEWVKAVLEAAKQNKNKEAAKGWHGDFLCTIEGDEELLRELNKKEVVEGFMSLMGIMPPEARKKYKDTPAGRILESLGIPLDASIRELNIDEVLNKASKLSADEIRDIRMHIWADFRDGALRDLMPVAPGEHQDAIFKLSGNYSAWKLMASGKQDVIRLRITGKLKLKVALRREVALSYVILRMKPVVTLVTEVFAEVPLD